MIWLILTLIRESWKNPKRGTVTKRVFQKDIQNAVLHPLYMFLCFGFFYSEIALGNGPENWFIFLFSAVYNYNFIVPTRTSQAMFLDFFPENALGNGLKKFTDKG